MVRLDDRERYPRERKLTRGIKRMIPAATQRLT
jgi:hypothetical protein